MKTRLLSVIQALVTTPVLLLGFTRIETGKVGVRVGFD
jgi:hypothetical protein